MDLIITLLAAWLALALVGAIVVFLVFIGLLVLLRTKKVMW